MQLNTAERWAAGITALLIFSVTVIHFLFPGAPEFPGNLPDLRAVMEVEGIPATRQLPCGYHYDLLQRCAGVHGARMDVRLSRRLKASLDSLRSDAVDLVMIPFCDSLQEDSSFVFFRVDSSGMWVFHSKLGEEASRVAAWIERNRSSEVSLARRREFFSMYDPFEADSAAFISPYDSLVRVCADTLGWDWKLLSAVVFKESRFRIESVSPAGASGLMQLMKSTAKAYGCSQPLDPEQNLRAGTALLLKLDGRYRDVAPDAKERRKIVLAAFNAGSGRIDQCIREARKQGLQPGKWSNLVKVIPAVEGFNGAETVSFVSSVTATWQRYCSILSEEAL